MAGVVPREAVGRPARRMCGQLEVKQVFKVGEFAPQEFPVVYASFNECGKLLQLLATDRSLQVERLQVVTKVRINIFVIVALGKFAEFPPETFVARVVDAA